MSRRPTHDIPTATLVAVQTHFHGVIRGRAAKLLDEFPVPLPVLQPPYPTVESKAGPSSRYVWRVPLLV